MTDTKTLERQTADDLARSLTGNPSSWSWYDSDYSMLRGPGGITLSLSFFKIYSPVKVNFGFWNRRRIKRAFKTWKRFAGNALADKDRHASLMTLRRCLVEMRAVA